MTPTQIVNEHIGNALEILKKTKCIYTVTDPFNVEHTNKPSVKRKKEFDWTPWKIGEQLKKAKPGDGITFPANGRPLTRLSSVASSKAHRLLGPNRHRVVQDQKAQTVTIHILAPTGGESLQNALEKLGITHD